MSDNTTPMTQTESVEELPEALTCEQLYSMEKSGERPTILDVREQSKWDTGHIDWATHLPLEKVSEEIEQIMPNKNELIITCCTIGKKSGQATELLKELGYTNVKTLSGGYTGYCGIADDPEMSAEESET